MALNASLDPGVLAGTGPQGIFATHWVQSKVVMDYLTGIAQVTYLGWASAATYAAGNQPLPGAVQVVTLNASNAPTLPGIATNVATQTEASVLAIMQLPGCPYPLAGATAT